MIKTKKKSWWKKIFKKPKPIVTKTEQLVLMAILFVTGLWCVDIGASAMVLNATGLVQTEVAGFGWQRSPVMQYHLGLFLALGAFIYTAIMFIREMNK